MGFSKHNNGREREVENNQKKDEAPTALCVSLKIHIES